MNKSPRYLLLVFTGLILTSPALARETEAQNPDVPHINHFTVWIGTLFTRIDSEITLDGSVLPGDILSGEHDLGLTASDTVVWGGARWRFHKRNALEFEYTSLDRSHTGQKVSDPVQIGDTTVQVGGRIDTDFNITLARLTWGYNFWADPRKTFAVKAGIHWLDTALTLQLSGDLIVDGNPVHVEPTIPIIEDANLGVPLPHVGMSFAYAVTPKLGLHLEGIGFALGYENYNGKLIELIADVQYWPWRNVGVGAGYRFFGFGVEDKDIDGLDGQLKYNYHGPSLYITAGF